jgi:NAD(P)-dependent dehydrogenase (short-subunit alcohol dehydrogenase family)
MNLQNARVLITGANGGLGQATSIAVAREGAQIVLACRTAAKAEATREAVNATVGADLGIAAGGFDMLDPSGIEAAVDALGPEPFDAVFLQAGGWVWADAMQTVEFNGVAIEETIAKNVLGAHATLRALLATGRMKPGARVVIIGGEGARGVPGSIGRPEFSDAADFARYLGGDSSGRTAYSPIDALGVAKLAAALWAQRLSRMVDGEFEVLWFTPGLIGGTGGTAGMPKYKEFIFQRIAFPILVALGKAQWPAAAAAKCTDFLAGRVGQHGDLSGAPEGQALGPLSDQKPMSPHFTDLAMQDVLWQALEAAVGPLMLANPAPAQDGLGPALSPIWSAS